MGDDILGPFSKKEITKSTLGPFSPDVPPGEEPPSRPMLESMGVTPAEFKSLLDANPDAKAMLSQPEAENLYAYLNGSKRYDIHVLNNLFAELSTGLRARIAARQPYDAGRPARPRLRAPGAPGWPYGHDGAGGSYPSRGPITWDSGPAEQGEPSNQAPSQWWLEGGSG